MALQKTVIHVHTSYSFDSNTTPRDLVETARRQGVTCVAVTDHDEVAGAYAVRELAGDNLRVIVGSEISTSEGHPIGLFIREWIPAGLSAEETARRIREQGGLVLAPHPASTLCDHSLQPETMERIAPLLDAVEVHNAQNLFFWEHAWARRFAARHDIAAYVGADSHIRGYLDAAYQLMPASDGPAGFLAALRVAERHAGWFGPAYFAQMGLRHFWDKFSVSRLPGFGLHWVGSGNDGLEPESA